MARILVIDDAKNILKMVRLTLERDGHTVEVAEDGVRGLELFGDGAAWDLVLTDQRMPGLEGRALTREVLRRAPTMRIVMMTSFATIELASDVLRAGATDFLRKPFSADILRGAVNAALARPRHEIIEVEEPKTILTGPLAGLPVRPPQIPSISFYLNGFTFWPVPASEQERQIAQNLNIYRIFQVRGPSEESSRCIVGVMPHIEEWLRLESISPTSDFLWERMCCESLTNYLWQKAEMPPTMLPVYELTNSQVSDIRRLSKAKNDLN